jgi:mannose-6-phosphate isomerase-like protein (cupin superfamily)
MQLGVLAHAEGKIIVSHMHKPVSRRSNLTQEVLVVRKGRIRVDFYDNNDEYLESRILERGDVILLVSGGHGFEVLEDVDMIEVKTGPYIADDDKRVFQARLPDELRFPD